MIMFGSRVDLYLPPDVVKLRVAIGDACTRGRDRHRGAYP